MNLKTEALADLESTRQFFNRTLESFTEADSGFQPDPAMMTVAQHVGHVAGTLDWFLAGALDDQWDMDFEKGAAEIAKIHSLDAVRGQLEAAWQRLRTRVEAETEERLGETLPDNPILPGRPRFHLVSGIVDHTGHHRGSLAVYARLLGRTPAMPYM